MATQPPPYGGRVFVLCTGRCGSLTYAEACQHITNWTSGHETRITSVFDRLHYPQHHIEVDNRLAWFLGSLRWQFPEALYVHLQRDPDKVAASFASRFDVPGGIMGAFASGVVHATDAPLDADRRLMLATAYVDTVLDNINLFMESLHESQKISLQIEDPHRGFDAMWDRIGAQGDRHAAHEALGRRRNASRQDS